MMTLLAINVKSILMLAILAIIAVSCAKMMSRGRDNKTAGALTGYSSVDVEQFQALIADSAVQLLDVRTREEYDEGHIARSILVDVNENDFADRAAAVLDKQRPVAVYCRSGRRSARAANLLVELGYKVTNLTGGVMAWQDAGKSLVK